MTSIPRLAAPPRDVPAGLRLRLLASYDVTGTSVYLLPALAALAFGAHVPDAGEKAAMTLIGAAFFAQALRTALPALFAARRTLGFLRNGHSALGHIVSCRLGWDRKGAEIPYPEFLKNWLVHTVKSEVGAFDGCLTGCLINLMIVVFIVPFLLVLIALVIQAHSWTRIPELLFGPLDPATSDIVYVAKFVGMSILFVAAAWVYLRFISRPILLKQTEDYIEERRGPHSYNVVAEDEHELPAGAAAAREYVMATPSEPLPDSDQQIKLVCQVEFKSPQGEPLSGEGTVRFTNRLDPAGIERLIFYPERPGTVVFLAGLPDEARIAPNGEWEPVASIRWEIALAVTAVLAAASLATLIFNLAAVARAFGLAG